MLYSNWILVLNGFLQAVKLSCYYFILCHLCNSKYFPYQYHHNSEGWALGSACLQALPRSPRACGCITRFDPAQPWLKKAELSEKLLTGPRRVSLQACEFSLCLHVMSVTVSWISDRGVQNGARGAAGRR